MYYVQTKLHSGIFFIGKQDTLLWITWSAHFQESIRIKIRLVWSSTFQKYGFATLSKRMSSIFLGLHVINYSIGVLAICILLCLKVLSLTLAIQIYTPEEKKHVKWKTQTSHQSTLHLSWRITPSKQPGAFLTKHNFMMSRWFGWSQWHTDCPQERCLLHAACVVLRMFWDEKSIGRSCQCNMVIAVDSLVSVGALRDPCNILPAVCSPHRWQCAPHRSSHCHQPNPVHDQLFIAVIMWHQGKSSELPFIYSSKGFTIQPRTDRSTQCENRYLENVSLIFCDKTCKCAACHKGYEGSWSWGRHRRCTFCLLTSFTCQGSDGVQEAYVCWDTPRG